MSLVYRKAIQVADKFVPQKFQPLWNHPAGNIIYFDSLTYAYLK